MPRRSSKERKLQAPRWETERELVRGRAARVRLWGRLHATPRPPLHRLGFVLCGDQQHMTKPERPTSWDRLRDGRRPVDTFYVILMFDQEGYYSSVEAPTQPEVKAKATARLAGMPKTRILACSIPLEGTWSTSMAGIRDVSMPPDFRPDLGRLDRPSTDGDVPGGGEPPAV